MQQYSIQFGSRTIEFTLLFQARKSLGIKVFPDTAVQVSAPLDTHEQVILQKVKSKAPWILKQIDFFHSFRPLTPPRRFISGESHLYLGRQYKLKVVQDVENRVKAYQGQLWVHTKNTAPQQVERLLLSWYRSKAELLFTELLDRVLPRFHAYQLPRPEILIRQMNKRWGSCTANGKIVLNLELIKAPKACIEYVIIHELCHLIHHEHTRKFFALLEQMLPDWKKWKERLEYGMV
jgi:predicted metal-dependent hydrolase